ncbi:bifunctional cobalt-precorrin-7 (C(5))-methyltransferase/cobalt-precorrin-6B (C(15))-methyltransferase [Actinomadura viridis]|uniref:Precorrin-6Y C5,15-methyltransferase (Decarboxylating) n=1 Tax=Actinomadura viridis TaxID=58110 RepID=A0A931DI45_9ACTN|nr:precorrin-6y C5,15-methyltransferase (decarboxylating) subunit CbiE [Actinomadura viridis]MBG6091604.1 precorrin-6Y C5,15-methyltransferase (decarboxylating) [Actinomadura viridis]
MSGAPPEPPPYSLAVLGHDGTPLAAEARELLERAALVVGGARHLAALPVPDGARTVVMGDVRAALDEIDAAAGAGDGRRIVVVASGDPGFFGIVRALRERGHRPRVLPALSSVARAFARAGLPWDDALVVSAHGRELRRAVNACRAHPKVAVLTAPGAGPAELARALFPQTPRTFVVCEDLGGPRERVVTVRPAEASTRPWHDPNVVLVLDPRRAVPGERGWIAGPRPGPGGWALPDAAFGPGPVGTTAEVRALALARLGPRIGDLVWDVGAGAGEVGIECARFGAAVVAVERDEAACERVRRNVRAHRVKVAVSRGTAPAVLDHLPDPDAVFVGGGGPEVVRACASRALRSVVVVTAGPDRVRAAVDALRGEALTAHAVRIQADPALPAGPAGRDPEGAAAAFVVWGERDGADPSGRWAPVPQPEAAAVTVAALPDPDPDSVPWDDR